MRVLLSCLPAAGHFYPQVPLAWALRAAGHDVLFAVPRDYCADVVGAGLPAAAISGPVGLRAVLVDLVRAPYGVIETDADRAAAGRAAQRFVELAERTAGGLRDLVARWRPALMVVDPMWLVGKLVAADAHVRLVEHRWGLAPPASLAGGLDAALVPLGERLGLGGAVVTALTVDVCPRDLQLPEASPGQPMAYVPYNGSESLPEGFPEFGDRPSVLVTFGGLLPYAEDLAPVVAAISAAAGELDVDLVVAAPSEFAKRWAAGNERVRIAGRIPLGLVASECQAVVHHGGSGTMLTALAHGRPQVVLPHVADHFLNGARLAEVGAGVVPDDRSPAAIVEAIAAVLGDGRFAAAARTMAGQIKDRPSPAQVVDVLSDLGESEPAMLERAAR